jgi:hypothetical protein
LTTALEISFEWETIYNAQLWYVNEFMKLFSKEISDLLETALTDAE